MFQPMTNVGYTIAYVKDGTIHSKMFFRKETDKATEAFNKLARLHVKYAAYSMGECDSNYECFGKGKAVKLSEVAETCKNKIDKYLKQRNNPVHFVEDFGDFYRVVVAVERPHFFLVSKKDLSTCGDYIVFNND